MKSKYICYHSILDFIIDFNALQLAMQLLFNYAEAEMK